jgi:hypothetical protein
MDEATLAATRRSLHGVAELLIAGPQFRLHKTIKLAVTTGGIRGTKLAAGIEGTEFVWEGGSALLAGSCAELGALAGIDAGAPEGLYTDTSGVSVDEPLVIDPEIAELLLVWFSLGDVALRAFAPDEVPILWPEHFDLGIAVDEVNYGVSPGDSSHAQPYAYIGPWTPKSGPFWNASFGAVRSFEDIADSSALAEFFAEGKAAAAE